MTSDLVNFIKYALLEPRSTVAQTQDNNADK